MADRNVNILHLSDMHFTRRSESYNQQIILSALKTDLQILSDGPSKPDVIVFSDDLVHAADEEDVYAYFFDDLITPLLSITAAQSASSSSALAIMTPIVNPSHLIHFNGARFLGPYPHPA